jgi:hypothetical protein
MTTLIELRTGGTSRPAVYIAALVAAYLAAAALLRVVSATIAELFTSRDLYIIGLQWSDFATSMFRYVVVFALGVFLVLWLLAPISAAISLRLAIARAALSVAGGALLTVVVGLVLGVVGTLSSSIFGARFPEFDGIGFQVVGAVQGFVSIVVELGPVVLLAAVLVWLRLRSRSTTGLAGDAAV